MSKNNGFRLIIEQELAKQKAISELNEIYMALIGRATTLDKVTITLGRMGFTPDELAEFEDKYCQTELDWMDKINEDDSDLPKTSLEKKLYLCKPNKDIDDELERYVRPDRFKPYDERYNFNK